MDLSDYKLYGNTTMADITKEVVVNSRQKKDQIDILVSDLKLLIKSPNDAMVIVPFIRDYLDVGVKNDEQLVKLLAVVQRIMSKSADSEGGGATFLTDEEKRELMKHVDLIQNDDHNISQKLSKKK